MILKRILAFCVDYLAEDIFQDAFTKVINTLRSGRYNEEGKFLPWVIAHYFIYQLFYFTRNLIEVPSWVLFGLIFSIILDVIYLFLMVFNKQNRSLYEVFSNTKVIIKSKN